jgi:hypothetical protein
MTILSFDLPARVVLTARMIMPLNSFVIHDLLCPKVYKSSILLL